MAHGWSTGIVPLMSNYVLGIKPTAPGFKAWQICPVIDGGDLTWARGAVGTPSGPIKVRWEKGTDSSFVLQIDTPEDTNGVICVPTGGSKGRVVMDGMEVDGKTDVDIIGPIATAGEGFMVVRASGGVHMVTMNVGK
jgi:hypothetical protein